jgi:hypothetical protein
VGESHSSAEDARLSELLVVLSLGADLGMGQPMEHALRQCALALRIGERLALSAADLAVLYYVSLVSWVGCHIDAYEQAKWFGDDLALKANFRLVDPIGARSSPARQPTTTSSTSMRRPGRPTGPGPACSPCATG